MPFFQALTATSNNVCELLVPVLLCWFVYFVLEDAAGKIASDHWHPSAPTPPPVPFSCRVPLLQTSP